MMLLVITNMPDVASATVLAQHVIERRAAACVNLLAPCTSLYRWQDKIESASEIPVLMKTTHSAYPRLEALIRTEHPYELPEIIALPVSVALPEYLQWVVSETQIDQE